MPATTRTRSLSGLDLSDAFFNQAVAPLLAAAFPQLRYSCGLIGAGSEVLGFDDEVSKDHDWGPRGLLFLTEADHGQIGTPVSDFLSRSLPAEFRGYPTSFLEDGNNRTKGLQRTESGLIRHRIDIWTIQEFFRRYVGIDVSDDLRPCHWLAIPQQKLRTITGGRVFRDDLGLNTIREWFSYYPRDVWLYLLAAGWERIGQEEHLMGRSGYVGDDLGSAVIAARLCRDIMRLCFIMEKQYIPYPKWFGTGFRLLSVSQKLTPILQAVLRASSWEERERHLSAAYESLAIMHNASEVTDPMPTRVEHFYGRPFFVIGGGKFSRAIKEKIEDPEVKVIANRRLIGSVEFFSDSTDVLEDGSWFPKVVQFFGSNAMEFTTDRSVSKCEE